MPDSPASYEDLHAFCLFVGPNRSGSSLLGALVDAHANALVAHELDVFEDRGATGRLAYADRDQLFDAIARRSRRAAERGRQGKRRGGPVSYAVPGQHQGRADPLRVIGTKRANRTMFALHRNPNGLRELAEQVGVELRLVHVVRNPFDNVASMTPEGRDMRIPRYVRIAGQIAQIREAGWSLHDVFIEDVIRDPRAEIARLCRFLGLEPEETYLDDCARVVMKEPNESRHGRDWSPDDLATLNRLIGQTPWLRRYEGSEVR